MKRKWFIPIVIIAVWCILLCVLVYAESFSEEASIRTMEDAFWYAVVTLTTVGYGDTYPVTALGKGVGLLFICLSTGFLTFLIGLLVSVILGQVLPLLRLRMARKRMWYIFYKENEESLELVKHLLRDDGEACFIFLNGTSEYRKYVSLNGRIFYLTVKLEELLSIKKNKKYKYFILEEEGYIELSRTLEGKIEGEIYCQTECVMNQIPDNVRLFSRFDGCARLYWRQKPIARKEELIILIGCGKYGTAILERALMNNVISPEQNIQYHIFGETEEFQKNHYCLHEMVNVNGLGDKNDSVWFHEQKWNYSRELLEKASRIIICEDTDAENLKIYNQLIRYFVPEGELHIRLWQDVGLAFSFGTLAEMYVPDVVMNGRLNQMAMLMHEIYRNVSTTPVAEWEQLSEFTKQSNIAAAEHLLQKIRILMEDGQYSEVSADICREAYSRYCRKKDVECFRKIEHDRWMRFYLINNWKYGPIRNDEKRLHPFLVPYEMLQEKEQEKDDYAWKLLEAVADKL